MSTVPGQTLDRAGIEARIPHRGTMCLLDELHAWDAEHLFASSSTHLAPDNPMRTESGLLSPCIVEYAAQAMALHGGLLAPEGQPPSAGFLASTRSVQLHCTRLDEVAAPLQLRVRRLSGDAQQVMYEFQATDGKQKLVAQGRAVVVLNTALPMPS